MHCSTIHCITNPKVYQEMQSAVCCEMPGKEVMKVKSHYPLSFGEGSQGPGNALPDVTTTKQQRLPIVCNETSPRVLGYN